MEDIIDPEIQAQLEPQEPQVPGEAPNSGGGKSKLKIFAIVGVLLVALIGGGIYLSQGEGEMFKGTFQNIDRDKVATLPEEQQIEMVKGLIDWLDSRDVLSETFDTPEEVMNAGDDKLITILQVAMDFQELGVYSMNDAGLQEVLSDVTANMQALAEIGMVAGEWEIQKVEPGGGISAEERDNLLKLLADWIINLGIEADGVIDGDTILATAADKDAVVEAARELEASGIYITNNAQDAQKILEGIEGALDILKANGVITRVPENIEGGAVAQGSGQQMSDEEIMKLLTNLVEWITRYHLQAAGIDTAIEIRLKFKDNEVELNEIIEIAQEFERIGLYKMSREEIANVYNSILDEFITLVARGVMKKVPEFLASAEVENPDGSNRPEVGEGNQPGDQDEETLRLLGELIEWLTPLEILADGYDDPKKAKFNLEKSGSLKAGVDTAILFEEIGLFGDEEVGQDYLGDILLGLNKLLVIEMITRMPDEEQLLSLLASAEGEVDPPAAPRGEEETLLSDFLAWLDRHHLINKKTTTVESITAKYSGENMQMILWVAQAVKDEHVFVLDSENISDKILGYLKQLPNGILIGLPEGEGRNRLSAEDPEAPAPVCADLIVELKAGIEALKGDLEAAPGSSVVQVFLELFDQMIVQLNNGNCEYEYDHSICQNLIEGIEEYDSQDETDSDLLERLMDMIANEDEDLEICFTPFSPEALSECHDEEPHNYYNIPGGAADPVTECACPAETLISLNEDDFTFTCHGEEAPEVDCAALEAALEEAAGEIESIINAENGTEASFNAQVQEITVALEQHEGSCDFDITEYEEARARNFKAEKCNIYKTALDGIVAGIGALIANPSSEADPEAALAGWKTELNAELAKADALACAFGRANYIAQRNVVIPQGGGGNQPPAQTCDQVQAELAALETSMGNVANEAEYNALKVQLVAKIAEANALAACTVDNRYNVLAAAAWVAGGNNNGGGGGQQPPQAPDCSRFASSFSSLSAQIQGSQTQEEAASFIALLNLKIAEATNAGCTASVTQNVIALQNYVVPPSACKLQLARVEEIANLMRGANTEGEFTAYKFSLFEEVGKVETMNCVVAIETKLLLSQPFIAQNQEVITIGTQVLPMHGVAPMQGVQVPQGVAPTYVATQQGGQVAVGPGVATMGMNYGAQGMAAVPQGMVPYSTIPANTGPETYIYGLLLLVALGGMEFARRRGLLNK